MPAIHPLSAADRDAAAAFRLSMAPLKGRAPSPDARTGYDQDAEAFPAAPGVRYRTDTVGGVPGVWCEPADARADSACLLFVHGGGYMLGSAHGYRHFVGALAAGLNVRAFAVEYRRAPEHAFPAAFDDVDAAWRGLLALGFARIVVAGDSAGGGLALALATRVAATPEGRALRAVAVASPWVDLAQQGASMVTRAQDDPIFTPAALQGLADSYLQGADPLDPRASPLHAAAAALAGLPPLRIDVGDDEVLLDDALRYARRARDAGANVELAVWEGMPHVFQRSLASTEAAAKSLRAIREFLAVALARPDGTAA